MHSLTLTTDILNGSQFCVSFTLFTDDTASAMLFHAVTGKPISSDPHVVAEWLHPELWPQFATYLLAHQSVGEGSHQERLF